MYSPILVILSFLLGSIIGGGITAIYMIEKDNDMLNDMLNNDDFINEFNDFSSFNSEKNNILDLTGDVSAHQEDSIIKIKKPRKKTSKKVTKKAKKSKK